MKFNVRVVFLTFAASDTTMRPVPLASTVALQHDVRRHFDWAYEDDVASARALLQACNEHAKGGEYGWSADARQATLASLRKQLHEASHIVLVGAAVKGEELERPWTKGTVFVAADGAVGACFGRVDVLCVVTDLDGEPYLSQAVDRTIPLIVHAHGDNVNRWKEGLEEWATQGGVPLVLTHQTDEDFPDMHNVGGFTDGDRAACLLASLEVPLDRISYVGYAVDHVGAWSGNTNPQRKLEKLAWMERVLNLVDGAWLTRTKP